jgi:Flp pilus assembly protein TadG
MKKLRTLLRDQSGMGIVEFALLAPIMLSFLLGGFELTQIVSADLRVSDAAQTMADLISQQTTVNPTTLANYCSGAKLVMTPFSPTPLQIAVASVTNTNGTDAVDWTNVTCGSAAGISNAIALASPMIPNNGDSVIVVKASYSYTGVTHFVLAAGYSLTQTMFARPRNISQIAYN